jgi:hypothetical protein
MPGESVAGVPQCVLAMAPAGTLSAAATSVSCTRCEDVNKTTANFRGMLSHDTGVAVQFLSARSRDQVGDNADGARFRHHIECNLQYVKKFTALA